MKRYCLTLIALAVCALAAGCGDTGTANRPANSANTAQTANANTNANTNSSPAAAEAEIRKLMDTAAAALARNDADAMDKIYGENYMLVNLDGSVETRAQRLESLRSGGAKYTAFSYDEPNIRVNPEGTGAVVIARANIKGTMRGKVTDGSFRVTQVYSRMKDGSWKQVSAQATPITGSATQTATSAANSNTSAPTANSNVNK